MARLVAAILLFYLTSGMQTLYLSFKKPARSDGYVYRDVPGKATDGDDHSLYAHSSCFHSGWGHNEWIEVDLQTEYSVTSVTVINMVGLYYFHLRLEGAEVRIGSISHADIIGDIPNTKCGRSVTTTQIETSPIIDFICQEPITGQYVILWFPSKTEYLHVCEIKVYAEYEVEAYKGRLNPVGLWMLSYLCLISLLPNPNRFESTECVQIPKPINLTVFMDENFVPNTEALTIAFYIYPSQNGLGNILTFGNVDAKALRIEQTYSNLILYQSEVTVVYGDKQLTRAHVLLPDIWTFLALTFDGINKNIKLWRNGEIASIGYTDFTHLNITDNGEINITIGSGNEKLEMAMLQVYDRVLDEAEMKAARDRPLQDHIIFEFESNEKFHGQHLLTIVAQSFIRCFWICKANIFCDVLGFEKMDKLCILYATNLSTELHEAENGVNYFKKVPINKNY